MVKKKKKKKTHGTTQKWKVGNPIFSIRREAIVGKYFNENNLKRLMRKSCFRWFISVEQNVRPDWCELYALFITIMKIRLKCYKCLW